MYCGRFAKNANVVVDVGSIVQYFILIYLPFIAGGGVFSIKGRTSSFSFDHQPDGITSTQLGHRAFT